MIKVCSKSPNSIRLGNVTIPAYGSVLLASFPISMETNRLINKGIISVFYVKDETVITKDVCNDNEVCIENKNDSAEVITDTNNISTRKKRNHKDTVSLIDSAENISETKEPNKTKGDNE